MLLMVDIFVLWCR